MILHLSRYFKGLKHFQQFWEKTIREMCLMNVSEKEFLLPTFGGKKGTNMLTALYSVSWGSDASPP